jgi:hypothetical protein
VINLTRSAQLQFAAVAALPFLQLSTSEQLDPSIKKFQLSAHLNSGPARSSSNCFEASLSPRMRALVYPQHGYIADNVASYLKVPAVARPLCVGCKLIDSSD